MIGSLWRLKDYKHAELVVRVVDQVGKFVWVELDDGGLDGRRRKMKRGYLTSMYERVERKK